MNRPLLIALLLLYLSGCSREVPTVAPEAAVSAPAAAAPVPAALAAGETIDSAALSISFVEKPSCASGEPATITAKWDVAALGATSVAVFVENPANPKKLWVEAGASGEGTTGKWIYPDTRITVQDRDSGKLLATRLIEKPCKP